MILFLVRAAGCMLVISSCKDTIGAAAICVVGLIMVQVSAYFKAYKECHEDYQKRSINEV